MKRSFMIFIFIALISSGFADSVVDAVLLAWPASNASWKDSFGQGQAQGQSGHEVKRQWQ
jgi:hypothetical protein